MTTKPVIPVLPFQAKGKYLDFSHGIKGLTEFWFLATNAGWQQDLPKSQARNLAFIMYFLGKMMSLISAQGSWRWFAILSYSRISVGLPWWLTGKEFTCQCRRCRFKPWVRKTPWRRKWQPTPVFLPGESHGQRSLAGYGPQCPEELDITEVTEHAGTGFQCQNLSQRILLFQKPFFWKQCQKNSRRRETGTSLVICCKEKSGKLIKSIQPCGVGTL